MTKWVYAFGGGVAEGSAVLRDLLGGKGANLAEMSSLGLPVPPGFTLTTEVCSRSGASPPAGSSVCITASRPDVICSADIRASAPRSQL